MKLIRQLHEFKEDEEGATLVLWGVMFIILFGLVAMSFDMGRIGVTRSELQSYADHVALAAAGELDGETGARARAIQAAEDLIVDFQTYGAGGQVLSGNTDFSITFHNNLPDRLLGATQFVAAGDADAEYVRVQATQQTVPLTFANAFAAMTGGTPPNNNANAFAVAGMSSFTCNAVQILFCLPEQTTTDSEGNTTSTLDPNYKTTIAPGSQILLVAGESGEQWGPGNWGFIDTDSIGINMSGPCADLVGPGKNTGPLLRCILGAAGPVGGCISGDAIDTETGKKEGITGNSINTRFGYYFDSMNKADEVVGNIYAPAPVVTNNLVHKSGIEPNACMKKNDLVEVTSLPVDDQTTMGFPRDWCFYETVPGNLGTKPAGVDCSVGADVDPSFRFGDGEWDVVSYLATNYSDVPRDADGNGITDAAFTTATANAYTTLSTFNAALPADMMDATRHGIYLAEIGYITDSGLPGSVNGLPGAGTPKQQSGLPTCGSTAFPNGTSTGADRREMLAVGVHCGGHDGGSGINGSETGVNMEVIVRFFLTEPVDTDKSSLDIWGEVIEFIERDDVYNISIFREVPQLVD